MGEPSPTVPVCVSLWAAKRFRTCSRSCQAAVDEGVGECVGGKKIDSEGGGGRVGLSALGEIFVVVERGIVNIERQGLGASCACGLRPTCFLPERGEKAWSALYILFRFRLSLSKLDLIYNL